MVDLFVAEQAGPAHAPRVVLVHGSLDRSSALARTARQLSDLAVVRYDRRGYGRSLAAGPCRTIDDQVDDLAQVVAGHPGVLVGHSLGGVIVLAFAQRWPELALAAVAYEAPMPWEPWWPGSSAGGSAVASGDPADAAERFMRRMIGDARWDALPERTRAQRRAEGPALVAELRSIRPPAAPPFDPAGLSLPVVVGHGSESSPHHQATARALAAALPHAELVEVEGAGHGVHLTHPGAFADLARRAVALATDRSPGRTPGR